ncbi:hypothetical protein Cfor_12671 [Coptotermes formosanus]|uniref:Uncharacterized protein n=1 Tax=Coptotermes formosanus TaxID=36987 RepID=A0A6L2PZB9_COPFO|nr:hypothetical protein Cfor_12671 [Coptotermes formosanus]
MSSANGLLQKLDRVSSETMSHHLQKPKEKVCTSLTLSLKTEGHMFDESDHMITESTEIEQKGALRLNGSVENCSSELIRMKKGAVILNGAESFDSRRNKVGFLSGFEAPFGVMDASSSMSHNTRLGKPPNLASSSDSTQFPQSFDTSDKLQLVSLQKTSDVLHVTDQSSPSSSPTDSALLCDQEDVAHSDPNRTSQFLSTVPTHTRSLSQTTSQLTSLIEKSESGNVGDTSHVNNLFEGSCVQVLSDKWGATHLKNAADTPNLYKPQVSPCDMCDVRTVQEPTTSVGHSTEPDISDVKEESDFKSSHEQPQCCGEVLQSFPLEPEAKVSSGACRYERGVLVIWNISIHMCCCYYSNCCNGFLPVAVERPVTNLISCHQNV